MNAITQINFEQAEHDRIDELNHLVDIDKTEAMRAIKKLGFVAFEHAHNSGHISFESVFDARIDKPIFKAWNALFAAYENNDPMITVCLEDFMGLTREYLEEEAGLYAEDKNGVFK